MSTTTRPRSVVVGTLALGGACCSLLCTTVVHGQGCDPQQVQELFSSDGALGDSAGEAVCISGDVAVIGAWLHDHQDEDAGAAYVHRLNPDTLMWEEEQELSDPNGAAIDAFGASVVVGDDLILVGATRADGVATNSGAVFAYRFDGSLWVLEQTLFASDGGLNDRFGISVATSGDVVLIGAYADDDRGGDAGAAYVFRWDGDSWEEEQKLTASDGASFDWFGWSVALDGDVAVVGAYNDNLGRGAAYVFRWSGSGWEEEQKLTASDGVFGDWFGFDVAISADRALIGAPGDFSIQYGAAYVYTWNGATWGDQRILAVSQGDANDALGTGVAIEGDFALVGAPTDAGGYGIGSAYLYRWNGSTWIVEPPLTAVDGALAEFFGYAVSLSNDRALIGAWGDDDIDGNAGSAYVFELECSPACPADISGDGEVGVTDLTFVILAWGQAGGAADVDGDGIVGVLDLIEVITAWGPCS